MESSLEKIKQLIKKEIGLDANTVGEATINKILNQRMRSCQITELDDYYNFLLGNNKELHLLLETSVIPETWFFRDQRPFDVILNQIRKNLLKKPNKTCNILCIPCSTGEEPYSISMFLIEQGIPDQVFKIQAVDISYQSLEIARNGFYGKNSFRGKTSKNYIDKYFKPEDSQHRINDEIRSRVEFNRINILDKKTTPFTMKFDFILCRNLLIYFDVPTKEKAFSNLNDLLTDDGILFIGHSEFGSVPTNIFKTVKKGDTFCLIKSTPEEEQNNYKKQEIITPQKYLAKKNTIEKKSTDPKAAYKGKPFSKAANTQTPKPENNASTITTNDLLKSARKHADNGQFGEAETLCLKYIEKQGDHSESFFLLGLISEASGKTEQADSLYRKALYLDPKHYETLVHLSFIVEQKGDIETSKRLRDRANRSLKH